LFPPKQTKLEIRNPKFEASSKSEISKQPDQTQGLRFDRSETWSFEFISSFEFLDSDLPPEIALGSAK